MRKSIPNLPELVKQMSISIGRCFDSPSLKARMFIRDVNVPENKLSVHIVLKDGTGEWDEIDWNLHHTIIGIKQGTYTRTGNPETGRLV